MKKKLFFSYKIVFSLILSINLATSYAQEEKKPTIIYENEAVAEEVNHQIPKKLHPVKIAIVKNGVTLIDGFSMYKNSKNIFVPVITDDFMVFPNELVYVLEEGEETSEVLIALDANFTRGRIKNDELSYDINDFKNSKMSILIENIEVYNDPDDLKGKPIEKEFVNVTERKDGWLEFAIKDEDNSWVDVWGSEKDINFDYNSEPREIEIYDI